MKKKRQNNRIRKVEEGIKQYRTITRRADPIDTVEPALHVLEMLANSLPLVQSIVSYTKKPGAVLSGHRLCQSALCSVLLFLWR